MNGPARIPFDYGILRLVPHPHLEQWEPVGVVVHARTPAFLEARVLDDPVILAELAPALDADVVARYLKNWAAIARGDEGAGPVALYPPSERFHWLTCPRSDVLQSSPVRRGLAEDPATALRHLWEEQVAREGPGGG
jgi:hypothetical protein